MTGKSKVTAQQRDAAYHCGIGWLLRAAYQRDFNMMEMGRCKTKYSIFDEWYATLNQEQKTRVEKELLGHYFPANGHLCPQHGYETDVCLEWLKNVKEQANLNEFLLRQTAKIHANDKDNQPGIPILME